MFDFGVFILPTENSYNWNWLYREWLLHFKDQFKDQLIRDISNFKNIEKIGVELVQYYYIETEIILYAALDNILMRIMPVARCKLI